MHVQSIRLVRCLTEPNTKVYIFHIDIKYTKKNIKIDNTPDQAMRFSQSRQFERSGRKLRIISTYLAR